MTTSTPSLLTVWPGDARTKPTDFAEVFEVHSSGEHVGKEWRTNFERNSLTLLNHAITEYTYRQVELDTTTWNLKIRTLYIP